MEVVSTPIYDWGCAASSALRMAARITGRHEIVVPRTIGPERLGGDQMLCTPGA